MPNVKKQADDYKADEVRRMLLEYRGMVVRAIMTLTVTVTQNLLTVNVLRFLI